MFIFQSGDFWEILLVVETPLNVHVPLFITISNVIIKCSNTNYKWLYLTLNHLKKLTPHILFDFNSKGVWVDQRGMKLSL